MILTAPLLRTLEHVDRRALGGFRFVDAVTRLPIIRVVTVAVRGAALIGPPGDAEVPLDERSVQIRPTHTGIQAVWRAPYFTDYADAFDGPQVSPATLGRTLRLRLALTDAGPHYLPQEFTFDLPRALDPSAANSVLLPMDVELFRTPGAPVLAGWSVLRVRVAEAGTGHPLPGVLVRVFTSPRTDGDAPLGRGMTEWRGHLTGEALVPVAGIPRFRPGAGAHVFETTQAVHFEAVRDPAFTGAAGALPDVPGINAGTLAGLVRRRSDKPPGSLLAVQPPAPLDARAGQEAAIRLTMP